MSAQVATPPTPSVQEPHRYRFTRDEYHRMAEAGLFDGKRVELIAGEILEMTPQKNQHFIAIELAQRALKDAFGPGHWVRIQGPLQFQNDTEPEPDVAVVRGDPRDFRNHPTSALIVVEVSDSTLRYDRTAKASLYASAGVRDYWVVNLIDRQVEVHRSPVRDEAQPFGWSYAERSVIKADQSIAQLEVPQRAIPAADFLP